MVIHNSALFALVTYASICIILPFCCPAGKVAAVSVFRFAKVTAGADGLSVEVRGAPSETVELLFAKKTNGGSKFTCTAKTVSVGADGTAVVHST